MKKNLGLRTNTALGFIFAFLLNSFGPLPAYAQNFVLPAPGVRVGLSPEFNPPILKGLKVHPDNPFRFDFILDQGDSPRVIASPSSSVIASEAKQSQQEQLKQESTKLIKYFLASLTIPEKDLWVNLSPYEKNRIVPESFGQTEMGRDLLAEDYMLKQITASLIYPEDDIGRKFWKRIYEESAKKFGTTNIPVNTFNKVWIVPSKAVVYENAKAGTAYVVESKLKVMLEQDYLALSHTVIPAKAGIQDTSALGSQIIRELVIPELTKEVNEGQNFSQLRQVYNSLILATWYKKKIKDSILAQVYNDQNKIQGLVIPAKAGIHNKNDVEAIYQQYLQAFKKGAYNYIKEDIDLVTSQPIPRKYFAGGESFTGFYLDSAMIIRNRLPSFLKENTARLLQVSIYVTNSMVDGLRKIRGNGLRSLWVKDETITQQQLYLQQGTIKWRDLDEYSKAFGVDLRELIKEEIQRKGKVIFADVGMGMGVALSEAVIEFSPRLIGIGVDPVDWNGENDLNKKHITFIQSDARSVIFPEPPDIITSYAVLQYDENPIKAFEHLFNQLNEGGTLMVNIILPDDRGTLDAYLNMLDYLRRKAEVRWRYGCGLLDNGIELFITAKKKNENIVLKVQKISVENKVIQHKGMGFIVKRVRYRYEPKLVHDNDILGYYLQRFLMIAIREVIESINLSSRKQLQYDWDPKGITISYDGEEIFVQELKDRILVTVDTLFRQNNLIPPQVHIQTRSFKKEANNYIILGVSAQIEDAAMALESITLTDGAVIRKKDFVDQINPNRPERVIQAGQVVGFPMINTNEGRKQGVMVKLGIKGDFLERFYTRADFEANFRLSKQIPVKKVRRPSSERRVARPNEFTDLIKKIMKRKGIESQAELARRIGWSSTVTSFVMRGLNLPVRGKLSELINKLRPTQEEEKQLRKFYLARYNTTQKRREPVSKLGEAIRKARIDKGWTQKELADRLGYSDQVIIFWEVGVKGKIFQIPNRKAISGLAIELGVDYDYLMKLRQEALEIRDSYKKKDKGQLSNDHTGGIDFNSDKINLQVKMDSELLRVSGMRTRLRGNDNGIKFHIDPAMLQRLQNAPGFVPVIINIQPLKSLPEFLGIRETAGNSQGVG